MTIEEKSGFESWWGSKSDISIPKPMQDMQPKDWAEIGYMAALHRVEAENPKPMGHFYNRPSEGRVGEAIERFWDYLQERGVAPKDRPILDYDEYMIELREYVEDSRSARLVRSAGEAQARELLILADEIIDELNGDWKSRCIHLAIQEFLSDGPFDDTTG